MCGSSRHGQRFVVHHQIKQLVVILHEHPLYAESDKNRQFPSEGTIIGAHRRHGARENRRVPVLVLEALAIQGGATRRTPQQKAPGHHVGRRPDHVAHALEAKHRVEDVKRDGGHRKGGIGSARCNERGNRPSLANTLLQNLPVNGFPISI